MKKIIIPAVIAVFLMVASSGYAAEGYGAGGCGLGSMLIGNDPGIVQIFASTTNGTSGNQTFGITSGTSNCEKQAKFSSIKRLNEFVQANMDNLAKDIAMGHGESLSTLAELLKISADNKPVFYSKMQSNFTNIFTSEKVEAADVIDNIFTIING